VFYELIIRTKKIGTEFFVVINKIRTLRQILYSTI